MIDRGQAQIVVTATGLALLWALEGVIPFKPGRTRRARHGARNLALGALNAAALGILATPLIVYAAAWAEAGQFGLLRWTSVPGIFSTILALLLLDCWMYLWHQANHRLPILWRFHQVHHSDPEMDATTAVRFHTGEIAISVFLRLGVITLLGISSWQALLYDLLLMPVILFHHSNVRFPANWDRWLRVLVASPAMHRVHHSRVRVETDSNYSSVFSFWDRLGRSFRLRTDQSSIRYGLSGYDVAERQSVLGMWLTPFAKAAAQTTGSIANQLLRRS